MKAQAGIEYMIIFGFSLLIVGLVWIYININVQGTNIELQIAHARNAAHRIAETADMAYIEGAPAQFYIYPSFPDGIINAYISENDITLELRIDSFGVNVTAETFANITGNLYAHPGIHKILVRANNSYVEIIDGG